MLKKIPTRQLEVGMYLHAIEGSYFDHPFWRLRFLLTKEDELAQLAASGIKTVTIDTSRGKDLPGDQCSTDKAGEDAGRIEPQYQIPLKSGTSAQSARVYFRREKGPIVNRLSERERLVELDKAATTIKESRAAVMSLFDDARLGKSVQSKKLAPLVEQISDSVKIDPTIILNVARLKSKDEYTYLHSVAVCALMINLGRRLKVPEHKIEEVGMAGLLHDVGKTSIPESILSKPGKLNEEEWETVRNHPQRGHDILEASEGVTDIALEVCLRHHEKMDGSGYPGNIKADQLSIFSRMSAVCDVYDAITSQRSYNKPLSASQALGKMQSWSGHFDPLVLDEFVDSLGILPIGTLVRLDHDELAIVIGESPADFAAPIVRCFHSLDKNRPVSPDDIDLGSNKLRRLMAVEDPQEQGIGDWSKLAGDLLAAPNGQQATAARQ